MLLQQRISDLVMIWYLNSLHLLFALLFQLLFFLYSHLFNFLCSLLFTNLSLHLRIPAALKLIKSLLVKHLMGLALIVIGSPGRLHSFLHRRPACCLCLLLYPVLFVDYLHEIDLFLLLFLPLFLSYLIFFLPFDILLFFSQFLFLTLFLHFYLNFLPDTIHVEGFFKILLSLLRSRLWRWVWIGRIRDAKFLKHYIISILYQNKSFMRVQLRLSGIIALSWITHLGIRMIYLSKFAKCIFGLLGCASTINLQ